MISLTSPVETRAHGWPAGLKLALLCATSTGLLLVGDIRVHAAALALALGLHALPGGLFLRSGLAGLHAVLPFVAILLVWHAATGDLAAGAVAALRMATLVALANLVTMTTRLSDLVDLVRRLTAPLRRIGLPVHALDTAIPLAIRFTPVLAGRAATLATAWRARSRCRPRWRLILPLALLAMDDADAVADALRARGGLLDPRIED